MINIEWIFILLVTSGIGYAIIKLWAGITQEDKFYAHLKNTNLAWQERLNKYVEMQTHLLISDNTWHEARRMTEEHNKPPVR